LQADTLQMFILGFNKFENGAGRHVETWRKEREIKN
jgi:hypothetical protein